MKNWENQWFFSFSEKNAKRRLSSVIIVKNVTRYLKMMTKKHWFNPVAWKLFERQLFLILAQLMGGGILENSTWGPRNVWKLEVGTKMKMFFKKEKNICNIAIRIEYRIACIAIRIVSQSYCIVTTLLSYFFLTFEFADTNSRNVRARKTFKKK